MLVRRASATNVDWYNEGGDNQMKIEIGDPRVLSSGETIGMIIPNVGDVAYAVKYSGEVTAYTAKIISGGGSGE